MSGAASGLLAERQPARGDGAAGGRGRAVILAAAGLAGLGLLLLLWSDGGGPFRRFARTAPHPATTALRVAVTSGEPVIPFAGAVTLAAYVEYPDGTGPDIPAPRFVVRDRANGIERHLPARRDATGAYHVTLGPVLADCDYRFVGGAALSDWFRVTVLEPVGPGDDSTLEVVPPVYVADARRRGMPRPLGPVHGYLGGTAEFRLSFPRPVADAYLEFRGESGLRETVRATLAADGRSATAALRLRHDGTVRVVTVVERDGKRLAEERALPVFVQPDRPPELEEVVGVVPAPVAVRPGEVLRVGFVASDDWGVTSADLEWLAPGRSEPVVVPIRLESAGPGRVRGRLDWSLDTPAAVGEPIRYRLRVRDNRRLTDPELGPQEVVYPSGGWAVLRVDAAAPPWTPQAIAGRHAVVADALATAADHFRVAAETAENCRDRAAASAEVTVDLTVRLEELRGSVRAAADALAAASRELMLDPESRPLAAVVRSVLIAREPVDTFLRDLPLRPPRERGPAWAAVARHVRDLADRTADLCTLNDRLRRDRLDLWELERLGGDLKGLASRLPDEPSAERSRQLGMASDRLRGLIRDSETAAAAVALAERVEYDRLAAVATDLAGATRHLAETVRQLAREVHDDALADVLSVVSEWTRQTAAALDRCRTAGRLVPVTLPSPQVLDRIAGLIAGGRTLEALTELETFVRLLDELADRFEQHAAEHGHPQAAVRRYARWQTDLGVRLRSVMREGSPEKVRAEHRALAQEQRAVREAVAALAPGAVTPPARAALDATLRQLAEVERVWDHNDTARLESVVTAAVEHLSRLAEHLPGRVGPNGGSALLPPPSDVAADYLPSPRLAAVLRASAAAGRTVRLTLARLATDIERKLWPSDPAPLDDLIRRQHEYARLLGMSLGQSAGEAGGRTGREVARWARSVAEFLRQGDLPQARATAERLVVCLRESGHAAWADRQEDWLCELTAAVTPDRLVARQVAYAGELAAQARDLAVAWGEAAGRDEDAPSRMALVDAARQAVEAGRLTEEAARLLARSRSTDAAVAWEQAEVRLRAAAGRAAGAGPAPTLSPDLEPEWVALGTALRLALNDLHAAARQSDNPAAVSHAVHDAAQQIERGVQAWRDRRSRP